MFNKQLLFNFYLKVEMSRIEYIPSKLPIGLKSLGMGLGKNGKPLIEVKSK